MELCKGIVGMNIENNEFTYSLTHAQKRIWYIEKIYPNTSINNIGGTVNIKGSIEVEYLEKAIKTFIKDNDGIRLQLTETGGEIKQYIADSTPSKIDFFDFSQLVDPNIAFYNWLDEEKTKPFEIENKPLYYFAIYKISQDHCGYFIKFNHLIADGWSINILTEHISKSYEALIMGIALDERSNRSYVDYIELEEGYFNSERFKKNKIYWNNKFENLPEFINENNTVVGKRKEYVLNVDVSTSIRSFLKDYKCSMNTFFVSLYMLYIHKSTQLNDVVIGTPVLNRSGRIERSIFGMFTSTMPLRYSIKSSNSIIDTINEISRELTQCYFHQRYPYDLLIQDLKLKEKFQTGLFHVCVNYYNTQLNTKINGFPVENIEFYNGNQFYPLQLIIKDWSETGELTLCFDYKIDSYTEHEVDGIYESLINLNEQIVNHPTKSIEQLMLLSSLEMENLVYSFNSSNGDYPLHMTIIDLFEEQVSRTPENIAIRHNHRVLTYRELNEQANQLARVLVNKGIGTEEIVGLLTVHSIETVIGILAILKAGGSYLPIDPSFPKDRIKYMLQDSGAKLLLMYSIDGLLDYGLETIDLSDSRLYTGRADNLNVSSNWSHLVYVIYTSGSTGKPKGTMIEHRSLLNYIWWAKLMYVDDEHNVFPLYSSLASDLTVTSIFTPLISGGSIVVYSDEDDKDYVIYRIIKENIVNIVKITPAHLSLIKEMNCNNSNIKRFIVGGEDLKVGLTRTIHDNFDGKIEIYNEYGPTETTVGCMIHQYNYNTDNRISVPIGVPAANVQIYILDNNLKPVPKFIVGEIYISGDGVARGYLNNEELTNSKFIDNPFIKGKRMYATGDLAKFMEDGTIEYIGRIGQQVKINGYRIELGEIESCLLNHESIQDAVVVDYKSKDSGYLCAYIVRKNDVSDSELTRYLESFLPSYMIPRYFTVIDSIPLTASGKLNKNLLPEPEFKVSSEESRSYRSEQEMILIDAIMRILNVTEVSPQMNFYQLGGDSIKAIQIASKLFQEGYKLKVGDILSFPIIEEMARHVEKIERFKSAPILCEGEINYTPIVSWFLSLNLANINHYNQSILLGLKVDLDINNLGKIMKQLVIHHDSFRINLNLKTGSMRYNNDLLNNDFSIKVFDLSDFSYMEQLEKIKELGTQLKKSFNIENDVLLRACLFILSPEDKRLLLTAHHLSVDGVSWRILIDDIYLLMKQASNGEQLTLLTKSHSYQKWSETLNEFIKMDNEKELAYWQELNAATPFLHVDYPNNESLIESSELISANLSQHETLLFLKDANRAYNTKSIDLLLSSLKLTVDETISNEKVIVEIESHGREELGDSNEYEFNSTVGWFTSMYPIKLGFNRNDLGDCIKSIKEEIRNVPHNGIGFGVYKYLMGALEMSTEEPPIRFNYLGEIDYSMYSDTLSVLYQCDTGLDYDEKNGVTALIDINVIIVDSQLHVEMRFSNKLNKQTMNRFFDQYMDNLRNVILHCTTSKKVQFTPSDFETVKVSQREIDSLFK